MTEKKIDQQRNESLLREEDLSKSILDLLNDADWDVLEEQNQLILKRKSNKNINNEEKYDKINEVDEFVKELGFDLESEDDKEKVYVLAPEVRYLRRTAEEFQAGAIPARDGRSHRYKNVGVSLSDNMHTAAKIKAKKAGVTFKEWMRAATRKALREGMDPEYELRTPVKVTEVPTPGEPS